MNLQNERVKPDKIQTTDEIKATKVSCLISHEWTRSTNPFHTSSLHASIALDNHVQNKHCPTRGSTRTRQGGGCSFTASAERQLQTMWQLLVTLIFKLKSDIEEMN